MSAERVFAAGRLRELLSNLRESFWFVPSLALLGAVLLGMALIEADLRMDADLTRRWPRLFGAGVEGARGTLSAIATSMITVAGGEPRFARFRTAVAAAACPAKRLHRRTRQG